jgi:hypothetical protein
MIIRVSKCYFTLCKFMAGYDMLGHVRPGYFRLCQARTGYIRLSPVRSVYVRSGYVSLDRLTRVRTG